MEDKVRGFLKDRFEAAILSEENFRGQMSFYIAPGSLVDICQTFLADGELDVKYLSDITCVDWYDHEQESEGRFELIYNLYSLTHCFRFFLKVRLDEADPKIPTLCDLWPSANWLEREVFDLFGIIFEGHPELTKILTSDDLEGHPLRRDFPEVYEEPAFSHNSSEPSEGKV